MSTNGSHVVEETSLIDYRLEPLAIPSAYLSRS